MSAPQLDHKKKRELDVQIDRVARWWRIEEAMAMRTLHYRNGFKIVYRCKWPSRAWKPRYKRLCPWWAYPRCRGNLFETRWVLIETLNARRVS